MRNRSDDRSDYAQSLRWRRPAPRLLRDRVLVSGMRIIDIHPHVISTDETRYPRSFPAWALAEEKNLPVCLQMTAKGIPQVIAVLKRFPKLRVIFDHLARPQQDDGPPYKGADNLWSLAAYPNVYLKVTERNLVGAHQGKATPESFFGKLVSDFGANRIAWGSNYPASEKSLPDLVKLAQETLSFLPARDREWIFSGTAQTLN